MVNVGHGDRALIEAATRSSRTQYVHGTMFTTEALETYAERSPRCSRWTTRASTRCPAAARPSRPRIKLARAYHLARGDAVRTGVIARRGAYHGNTLGALDASGKEPLRKPYTPWLGRFLHAPAAYEYRCENPPHPDACGAWHAGELERMI